MWWEEEFDSEATELFDQSVTMPLSADEHWLVWRASPPPPLQLLLLLLDIDMIECGRFRTCSVGDVNAIEFRNLGAAKKKDRISDKVSIHKQLIFYINTCSIIKY